MIRKYKPCPECGEKAYQQDTGHWVCSKEGRIVKL